MASRLGAALPSARACVWVMLPDQVSSFCVACLVCDIAFKLRDFSVSRNKVALIVLIAEGKGNNLHGKNETLSN